MVARLQFGSDGEPINSPTMTLAQEIGWHQAQVKWLESLGPNAHNGKFIASHRQEIERLLAQLPT